MKKLFLLASFLLLFAGSKAQPGKLQKIFLSSCVTPSIRIFDNGVNILTDLCSNSHGPFESEILGNSYVYINDCRSADSSDFYMVTPRLERDSHAKKIIREWDIYNDYVLDSLMARREKAKKTGKKYEPDFFAVVSPIRIPIKDTCLIKIQIFKSSTGELMTVFIGSGYYAVDITFKAGIHYLTNDYSYVNSSTLRFYEAKEPFLKVFPNDTLIKYTNDNRKIRIRNNYQRLRYRSIDFTPDPVDDILNNPCRDSSGTYPRKIINENVMIIEDCWLADTLSSLFQYNYYLVTPVLVCNQPDDDSKAYGCMMMDNSNSYKKYVNIVIFDEFNFYQLRLRKRNYRNSTIEISLGMNSFFQCLYDFGALDNITYAPSPYVKPRYD